MIDQPHGIIVVACYVVSNEMSYKVKKKKKKIGGCFYIHMSATLYIMQIACRISILCIVKFSLHYLCSY